MLHFRTVRCLHQNWNTLPVQNFNLPQSAKGLGLKVQFIYVSLYIVFMTMVIYLIESSMTKLLGGKS